MTMTLTELYTRLRLLEQHTASSKQLYCEASAFLNWMGDQLTIRVCAYERKGLERDKGWSTMKFFAGKINEAEKLLDKAQYFCNAIPSRHDRTIELAIRKLNSIVQSLPEGTGEISDKVWTEIRQLLLDKAEDLAKNCLPRQVGYSEGSPEGSPEGEPRPEDDIPY